MSVTPRTITDRIAIGDDKFILTQLPDGRIQLTPSPDTVVTVGTDVNKALLQLIEDDRANAVNHIAQTNPHNATVAPTADRLILRDAAARAQISAPAAPSDIARLDTVTNHAALSPHRQIYAGDDTERTHSGTTLTILKEVRIARSLANGLSMTRISVVLEGNVSAGTGTFEIWANGVLLFTLPTTSSTTYVMLQSGANVAWADNTVNTVQLRVRNSGANITRCRLWDVYTEGA